MEKEDMTHKIEIVVGFDPKMIRKGEIEEIILTRRDCCEIMEYEFEEDNLVRIFVYVFSAGQWNAKLIELCVNSLLVNMTFPDGVKKSDITVKVEELVQFQ